MDTIETLKGIGAALGIVLCILILKKFNKINQTTKPQITKNLKSQKTPNKENSSSCTTLISLYFAIMVGPPVMILSIFASDSPDSKSTAIIMFLVGLAITGLGIYIVVRTASKNFDTNKLKQKRK